MKNKIFALMLIWLFLFNILSVSAQVVYPIKDAITSDTWGLVGYWPVPCGNGSGSLMDYSGHHGTMTRVQTTLKADFQFNEVLYFDGIDDYCTQYVYASKVGTVTMATVASGALFNDTGQDFSSYAGASGNTPYMIVVTDTSGYKAWGYIGEEGTGETLGVEIIVNGTMEAGDPPTGWTKIYADTVLDGVADERTGGSGTQSLSAKKSASGTLCFKQSSVTVIPGTLYYVDSWLKNISGITVVLNYSTSFATVIKQLGITSVITWAQKTNYFTAVSATDLIWGNISGALGNEGRWDDISVKPVTALPANTGVKIYSTRNGSTQSWANVATLPNSVANYEVIRSDFQITEVSLNTWIKPDSVSVANELPIIGKRQAGTSKDGYMLYQYENDIYFRIDDADVAIFENCLTAGNWYNVCGTFDGTTAKVYVNGVIGSVTDTGTISNTYYACRVGYDITRYFAGSVTGQAIYNRALSATEVKQKYEDIRP